MLTAPVAEAQIVDFSRNETARFRYGQATGPRGFWLLSGGAGGEHRDASQGLLSVTSDLFIRLHEPRAKEGQVGALEPTPELEIDSLFQMPFRFGGLERGDLYGSHRVVFAVPGDSVAAELRAQLRHGNHGANFRLFDIAPVPFLEHRYNARARLAFVSLGYEFRQVRYPASADALAHHHHALQIAVYEDLTTSSRRRGGENLVRFRGPEFEYVSARAVGAEVPCHRGESPLASCYGEPVREATLTPSPLSHGTEVLRLTAMDLSFNGFSRSGWVNQLRGSLGYAWTLTPLGHAQTIEGDIGFAATDSNIEYRFSFRRRLSLGPDGLSPRADNGLVLDVSIGTFEPLILSGSGMHSFATIPGDGQGIFRSLYLLELFIVVGAFESGLSGRFEIDAGSTLEIESWNERLGQLQAFIRTAVWD